MSSPLELILTVSFQPTPQYPPGCFRRNNHASASYQAYSQLQQFESCVFTAGSIAKRNKCLLIARRGSHRCCTPARNILTDAKGFGTATRTDDIFLEISALKREKPIAFNWHKACTLVT